MISAPTAIKAYFGIHIADDLNGNRTRSHRSIEIKTSIHDDATRATFDVNVRNRQKLPY